MLETELLTKEPGIKNFSSSSEQSKKKDLSSEELANTFLKTEESLRTKLQEALEKGSKDASTLEKDISDFYMTIENKYGKKIAERQDFLDLMDVVAKSDSIYEEAKQRIDDINSSSLNHRGGVSSGDDANNLQEISKTKTYENTDTSAITAKFDKSRGRKFTNKKTWDDQIKEREKFREKFAPKKREDQSQEDGKKQSSNGKYSSDSSKDEKEDYNKLEDEEAMRNEIF